MRSGSLLLVPTPRVSKTLILVRRSLTRPLPPSVTSFTLPVAPIWDGTTFQDQTDAFFYDPVADFIQGFDNIPRATSNTRALNFNGNMWVMGGGFNLTSNEVNIYDTSIPDWIIGPAFMTARRNFPIDTDGTTRIWLAGGYASDGITPLNSMEIFCAGGPTPSPTPTPTCQVTYTTGSCHWHDNRRWHRYRQPLRRLHHAGESTLLGERIRWHSDFSGVCRVQRHAAVRGRAPTEAVILQCSACRWIRLKAVRS